MMMPIHINEVTAARRIADCDQTSAAFIMAWQTTFAFIDRCCGQVRAPVSLEKIA